MQHEKEQRWNVAPGSVGFAHGRGVDGVQEVDQVGDWDLLECGEMGCGGMAPLVVWLSACWKI